MNTNNDMYAINAYFKKVKKALFKYFMVNYCR